MSAPQPRLPAVYRLVRYDTVNSTNDEAKRLARASAEEGTLVWGARANRRPWASRTHLVFAAGQSLCLADLRPRCPLDQATQLGFIAALAVGNTLSSICNSRLGGLSYKWPNDVLARGRKIAGILLESDWAVMARSHFLSLSVSASISPSSPRDTEFPATSTAEEELGTDPPGVALEGFARYFEAWAERWREEGFAPVRAAWRARAAALGEPIQVRLEAPPCRAGSST